MCVQTHEVSGQVEVLQRSPDAFPPQPPRALSSQNGQEAGESGVRLVREVAQRGQPAPRALQHVVQHPRLVILREGALLPLRRQPERNEKKRETKTWKRNIPTFYEVRESGRQVRSEGVGKSDPKTE